MNTFSATVTLSAANTNIYGNAPFELRILPFEVKPSLDYSVIAIYYDYGDGSNEFVEYSSATDHVVDTGNFGVYADVNDPRNYGKTHVFRGIGNYFIRIAIYNNGSFVPDEFSINVYLQTANVYDYYDGIKLIKLANSADGKVVMAFEGVRGETEDIFIQKLD